MKSGSTNNNNNNRSGQSSQTSNPGTTGAAFVKQAEGRVVPGTDGCTCAITTCWHFQSLGHFADHCPTAGTADNALRMMGILNSGPDFMLNHWESKVNGSVLTQDPQ